MLNVVPELCYERQVMRLPRGSVRGTGEGKSKGLVVSEDGERSSLKKMPEVLDCSIHC